MLAASAKKAVEFILSAGQLHDAPQGRLLMETAGKQKTLTPLLMDRAYEDDYTRYIAQMLKFDPVVPPKSNRKIPWEYDKELYKLRNEIERLFRLLQGFRRIFCRFEKLDIMYIGFLQFSLVRVAIR
jgi:transposase